MTAPAQRYVVWGTFDTGKPRVRILIEALRQVQPDVPICHCKVWEGIEDKSQVAGLLQRLSILTTWLLAYPALIVKYLRADRHDVVLVPYPGLIDVLVLWPFARLRGARICWDMFISAYDTIVEDRALVRKRGLRARMIFALEWLATRLADRILIDTREHAKYITALFGLSSGKVRSVWVGVESGTFARVPLPLRTGPVEVLFYGQFIPLHGLDTIVDAIALTSSRPSSPELHFTIVGTGQDAARIDHRLAELKLANVTRVKWVDYAKLPDVIASADICLGVFAPGGKAARVIPNKVFQILAVGRPLITMDSPAIREIVSPGTVVRLVADGDAEALCTAICALALDLREGVSATTMAAAIDSELPIVSLDLVRQHLVHATETL